jgi:hypothetical protein
MPDWKFHLKFAALMYVVAVVVLLQLKPTIDQTILILSFPACLLASQIPDEDHPNSKPRKWTERILLGSAITIFLFLPQYYLIGIGFVTVVLLLWSLTHRGLFHKPHVGLIIPLPFILLNPLCYIFGIIGYESHILADRLWKNN